ncbi:MAG: InlB B-repeat-containing protein [Treponema sp.]|nr:InlB B-repeat-containing protein [Treponema sp.]
MTPTQKPLPSFPKEKGSFSLVLGGDIKGRTILPDTSLSSFAEFKLEFFPYEGGTPGSTPVTIVRTPTDLNTDPIFLDAGFYDLKVTAYVNTGGSILAAASGELLNFEIIAGGTNTGTVPMKVYVNGAGQGTFKWDITVPTVPAGLDEASITIERLNTTTGTPNQTLYFIGGPTTTISNQDSVLLNSGYYNVTFTLSKDTETQQIIRRDILHIYQNMESSITLVFSNTDFYTKNYLVTFAYDDGVTGDGIETVYYDVKIIKPTDPTRTGYVFGGWYTDKPAYANEWDFNNDTVTDDITLYAKWLTAEIFDFTFVINDNSPELVNSDIVIYPGVSGLSTATLKVANSSDYSPPSTNIKWYYNGSSLGSGDELILSSTNLGDESGLRFITVEAETSGGARYSTIVIVMVQVPAAKIGSGSTAVYYPTLAAAIVAATGTLTSPAEIVLLSDINVPETGMPATNGYTIGSGMHISLTVDSNSDITINALAGNFALFFVNSGASLSLDGSGGSLTLSGGNLAQGTNRRGIYIDNSGTVAMKDNVTIAGFKCQDSYGYYGGGVYVYGSSASFTMSGGVIYGSDIPPPLANTAYSYGAIYVPYTGTATYGGNYAVLYGANIPSSYYTIPSRSLPGTISITPNTGVRTYTELNAVYSGSETVSYQWMYGESSYDPITDLKGATKPRYTPTKDGIYSVTVSAAGYTDKTSSTVTVGLANLSGPMSIAPAGEVQPDTTITAAYKGNESVTVGYQWRKESSSISGANASMYMITDPGIYSVIARAPGYYDYPYSSSAGTPSAYIIKGTPQPLTVNEWTDGDLITTDQQDWYSFNVTAGTTYYIRLNSREFSYGDGTKTAYELYVSAIYSDGTIIRLDEYYCWSSGISFTPSTTSSGTVYLQVKPSYSSASYLGTYGIVIGSPSTRPPNNTLNPNSIATTPLTPNTWEKGTLSSTDKQHWYSFNATAGTTYYLWVNERGSSLVNTIGNNAVANIDVTAWYSDGSEAFANAGTAWDSSRKSFAPTTSGKITIQVRPYSGYDSSSYYGDYEIVYSSNDVKPSGNLNDWTVPASDPLTVNSWRSGNLTSTTQEDYYTFNVTAGTTYRVWWDDSYGNSYGSYTADVYVGACYANGDAIFAEQTYGYSSAKVFTATLTGTVYLQVKPEYASTSYLGSYRVVFSTGTTRP